MHDDKEVELVVILDREGGIVAAVFQREDAAEGPHFRVKPSSVDHKIHVIKVPAGYQDLTPERLFESVKQRLPQPACG
jgi:hypothetical protein